MSKQTTTSTRARRVAAALGAMAIAVAGLGATTASAAPPANPAHGPSQLLPERMRGESAIQAIGARLPDVAAANRMSVDELRRSLRADDQLWVDPTGALLFVDEMLAIDDHDHDHDDEHGHEAALPADGATTPAFGDIAPSDAFALHSRPGAERVIYLDFDGHDPKGSIWKDQSVAPPYDTDGAPSTFSDAERRVIIDVWRHVAEDFAPFAVNVTTQDPGIDAIRRTDLNDRLFGTRVAVTSGPTGNCTSAGGCGGVAYLSVFDRHGKQTDGRWTHDLYQPAWVYSKGTNAKYIAEAASHEAGHNLGLSHDGGTGTGYYQGHNGWAPIMGVGYYQPVTQWSKGEYAGATEKQDDLAVMVSLGAPLAADDHGNTPATATLLSGTSIDVQGVIGTAADVDAFRLDAGAGTLSLHAAPVGVGANLDIGLTLLDAAGAAVHTANPAGLAAGLDLSVAAGTYTLLVDGVGTGDPTTGYSDYASLGRYRLTGSVPATTVTPPPPPPPTATAPGSTTLTATAGTDGTVALGWSAADGAVDYVVWREQANPKNGRFQGRVAVLTTVATNAGDAPGTGTFRYQIEARNSAGSTLSDLVEVTVSTSGGTTDGGSTGGKGGGKPAKTTGSGKAV